jgi:hypothetical protein
LDLHGVEWAFTINQWTRRNPHTTNWGIKAKISLAKADDLIVFLNRICCLDVIYPPSTEDLNEFAQCGSLSHVTAVVAGFLQSINITCIREKSAYAVLTTCFLTNNQLSSEKPPSCERYSLE